MEAKMDFAEAISIAEECRDPRVADVLYHIEEDFEAAGEVVDAMIDGLRDLVEKVSAQDLLSQRSASNVEEIGDKDLLLFNMRTIATQIMFILREMHGEVIEALSYAIPGDGGFHHPKVVSAISQLKAINVELRENLTNTLKSVLVGNLTVFPKLIENLLEMND